MSPLRGSPHTNKFKFVWFLRYIYIPLSAPSASSSVFQNEFVVITLVGCTFSVSVHELVIINMPTIKAAIILYIDFMAFRFYLK
jgi:hypothetical protein